MFDQTQDFFSQFFTNITKIYHKSRLFVNTTQQIYYILFIFLFNTLFYNINTLIKIKFSNIFLKNFVKK
jgi:hypothetical protein